MFADEDVALGICRYTLAFRCRSGVSVIDSEQCGRYASMEWTNKAGEASSCHILQAWKCWSRAKYEAATARLSFCATTVSSR